LPEILDVRPDQRHELAAFLSAAFQAPADSFFLAGPQLEWKYFLPRPDWSGPRSRAVWEDGRMVAHAGVWPLVFEPGGRRVECVHLIDWGAVGSPGAGILIYKDLLACAPAALVVGAAVGARKLLGRMGFEQVGRADSYVRVVRPWKQLLRRPAGPLWKNLAKSVRNAGWAASPVAASAGWEAQRQDCFPDELEGLLSEPSTAACIVGRRSVASLNFLLRCPGAQCQAFLVRRGGKLRGYFLLSRLGGQGRIADLQIWGDSDDWAAGYSVAALAASRDPEVCEIVATSSADLTSRALERNGFRICGDRPLWLRDPQRLFAGAPPLGIQAAESDSFFLYDPDSPFAS
jgi:hypothetical protein